MMKLVREQLKPFGFKVSHESETLTVLENGNEDVRIILTATGTWKIFRKRANKWNELQQGRNHSDLLHLLGWGKNEKAET